MVCTAEFFLYGLPASIRSIFLLSGFLCSIRLFSQLAVSLSLSAPCVMKDSSSLTPDVSCVSSDYWSRSSSPCAVFQTAFYFICRRHLPFFSPSSRFTILLRPFIFTLILMTSPSAAAFLSFTSISMLCLLDSLRFPWSFVLSSNVTPRFASGT